MPRVGKHLFLYFAVEPVFVVIVENQYINSLPLLLMMLMDEQYMFDGLNTFHRSQKLCLKSKIAIKLSPNKWAPSKLNILMCICLGFYELRFIFLSSASSNLLIYVGDAPENFSVLRVTLLECQPSWLAEKAVSFACALYALCTAPVYMRVGQTERVRGLGALSFM